MTYSWRVLVAEIDDMLDWEAWDGHAKQLRGIRHWLMTHQRTTSGIINALGMIKFSANAAKAGAPLLED